MGYSLFVTRSDGTGNQPIDLSEWQSYWQTRSEFTSQEMAEWTAPDGTVFRMLTPNGVAWTAHPDGVPYVFQWREPSGEIVLDKPDDAVIAKAKEIADALGAVVRGEEGEMY